MTPNVRGEAGRRQAPARGIISLGASRRLPLGLASTEGFYAGVRRHEPAVVEMGAETPWL